MAQWQRICLPSRRWGFDPWIEIIPCRRKWKPTPMFFPEKPWTEDLVRLDHGITKQSELVTKQPWMLKKRCCLVTKSVQHFGNHLDFSPPCSFVHGFSWLYYRLLGGFNFINDTGSLGYLALVSPLPSVTPVTMGPGPTTPKRQNHNTNASLFCTWL